MTTGQHDNPVVPVADASNGDSQSGGAAPRSPLATLLDEAEKVRAELSRIRPVYDAAVAWRDGYRQPFTLDGCRIARAANRALAEAVDAATKEQP